MSTNYQFIVLEITYDRASTPSGVNLDVNDHRNISVFFRTISLGIDNKSYNTFFKIFGFYELEKNGFWSKGYKSCIIYPFVNHINFNKLTITIDAHPFKEAFQYCNISIKTSFGHRGYLRIDGLGSATSSLKKPYFPRNKRLVVGHYTNTNTKLNISLIAGKPSLSIILLNHDKQYLTHLAINATESSDIKVPFEIICFNNGSSAESEENLKKSQIPIKIINRDQILGFGSANNIASLEARGEFILFLNNDAFLDKGAVDEMLAAFRVLPDSRIVGSILRFPDGMMQEAGATLHKDGHPIRHGRKDCNFKARALPRFQAVDYVSGACLMIRKSDFLEMGGFAEKYSPAYYEDTDLCMRALLYRQKVYLASRANCYHIENASSSTIEQGAWATRTSESHREVFLKDWGAYLSSRDSQDLPWHLRETKQMTKDATD